MSSFQPECVCEHRPRGAACWSRGRAVEATKYRVAKHPSGGVPRAVPRDCVRCYEILVRQPPEQVQQVERHTPSPLATSSSSAGSGSAFEHLGDKGRHSIDVEGFEDQSDRLMIGARDRLGQTERIGHSERDPRVRYATAISAVDGQVSVMVGNFQVPLRISERG